MYDVYNLSTHDPCVVIVNTFVSELLCSSRLNEQQDACVQNTNVRMHAVPRSRIYKLLPIPKRNKWWHDLPISLQNLLLRQELVTNIMPYQFFLFHTKVHLSTFLFAQNQRKSYTIFPIAMIWMLKHQQGKLSWRKKHIYRNLFLFSVISRGIFRWLVSFPWKTKTRLQSPAWPMGTWASIH